MKIEFVYIFLLVQIWTLIGTWGTRFPRAVREPPRRTCACGVSLGLAIPAGVSHTRSNQLCLKIWIELLLPKVGNCKLCKSLLYPYNTTPKNLLIELTHPLHKLLFLIIKKELLSKGDDLRYQLL